MSVGKRIWISLVYVVQPFQESSKLWGRLVTVVGWLGVTSFALLAFPDDLSLRIAVVAGCAFLLAFIGVVRASYRIDREFDRRREALLEEQSAQRHSLFEASATIISDGERLANLAKKYTHIDWKKHHKLVGIRDDLQKSVAELRAAVLAAVKSIPEESLPYQRVSSELFSILDRYWGSDNLPERIGPRIDELARLNRQQMGDSLRKNQEIEKEHPLPRI